MEFNDKNVDQRKESKANANVAENRVKESAQLAQLKPPPYKLLQKKEDENSTELDIQDSSSEYDSPATPPNQENNKLSGPIANQMNNAFNTDFSDVNIHKNSSQATDVDAQAFTKGKNVHFAPGKYKPESQEGQELIGHELTHVVQQSQGLVKPTIQKKGKLVNDDDKLEEEADVMGKVAANASPKNPNSNNPNQSSLSIAQGNQSVQLKENENTNKNKIEKEEKSTNDQGWQDSDLELFGYEIIEYAYLIRQQQAKPLLMDIPVLESIAHIARLHAKGDPLSVNQMYFLWDSYGHEALMDVIHIMQSRDYYMTNACLQAVESISKVVLRQKSRDIEKGPDTIDSIDLIPTPTEAKDLAKTKETVKAVLLAASVMKGLSPAIENAGFRKLQQLDRLLSLPNAIDKINKADTFGKKLVGYAELTSMVSGAIEHFGTAAIDLNIKLVNGLIADNGYTSKALGEKQLEKLKAFGAKWSGAFKTIGGALSIVTEASAFWEAWNEGNVMAMTKAGVGVIGGGSSIIAGVLAVTGKAAAVATVVGAVATAASGVGLYLLFFNELNKMTSQLYSTIGLLKDEKIRNHLNDIVQNVKEAVKYANVYLTRDRVIENIKLKSNATEMDKKLLIRLKEKNRNFLPNIVNSLRNAIWSIEPSDLKYADTQSQSKHVLEKLSLWNIENSRESTFELLQSAIVLVTNIAGYHAHGHLGWTKHKIQKIRDQNKPSDQKTGVINKNEDKLGD